MFDWKRWRRQEAQPPDIELPEAQEETAEAVHSETRSADFRAWTQADCEQVAAMIAPALDEELARLAALRRWGA